MPIELCGLQWVRCVEAAQSTLRSLDEQSKFFELKYEDFVRKPIQKINEIFDFLDNGTNKNSLVFVK